MRRCRLLLSGLAALAGTALASSSSSPISVTVQQSVHVGDAIKFQWTGGTPPYTLKVYLNDKVVSQNEGWETNYVQWRANADQVPAGTSVRVRVTDSTGQSVMSEPTVVESDGKSVSTKKDSSYPNPTGHTTDHDKTGSGEATTDGGNTKSLMDDPNNRFSTSDGFGASAIQTGGRMLSAAVMPSDWQPTQGLLTLAPIATASLSAFAANATTGPISGGVALTSAAVTDAMNATAAATSASNAAATDVSDLASSASPTDTASAASTSDTTTASSSSGGLSTTAIVAIAAVILLLLAAGGGFWWWRSKQKDGDDQEQTQSGGAGKGRSKRKSRRSGHSSESGGDEEKLVGERGAGGGASDSETDHSDDHGPGKGGRQRGGRGGAYRDEPPSDDGSGTDDASQQTRPSRR